MIIRSWWWYNKALTYLWQLLKKLCWIPKDYLIQLMGINLSLEAIQILMSSCEKNPSSAEPNKNFGLGWMEPLKVEYSTYATYLFHRSNQQQLYGYALLLWILLLIYLASKIRTSYLIKCISETKARNKNGTRLDTEMTNKIPKGVRIL